MESLTELFAAARNGDKDAVPRLCELLYEDLRKLARSRLRSHERQTLLDTTALVHESYLRFVKAGMIPVEDRAHFMAYASRSMRSVIVDFLRSKQSERHGGNEIHVTLNTEIAESTAKSEDDIIRLNDALDEVAQIDPRIAQVVEMRYFAGLSEAEMAAALGVHVRTIRRDWEKAQIFLRAALS